MLKQKTGSLINIIGLSISLSACLVIVLFVEHELSFDKHNENYENIYRLLDVANSDGCPSQPVVFKQVLEDNIAELNKGAMLFYGSSNEFFRYNNENFIFQDLVFTTPSFFDIFSFEFVRGTPESALDAPNKIVISESTAKKMFGDKNPLGEIINYKSKLDYEISGVIKDLPKTAHFQVDLMASMESRKRLNAFMMKSWDVTSTSFYYLLRPNDDLPVIEEKISKLYTEYSKKNLRDAKFKLQPLSQIHLFSSNTTWDRAERGDVQVVLAFVLVALFIFCIDL